MVDLADALARRAWGEAYHLLASQPGDSLAAADLEQLAVSAYLIGEDDEAVAAWERAHRRHLDDGRHADAARCAFWAAFCLMIQGQMAHAGGWLRRAEDTIGNVECSASGYLLIPAILGALDSDDATPALDLAVRAGEIAERFADRNLGALALLGRGQALLRLGDEAGGLARLDEVMLSVRSGEVGPIAAGVVYCAVILECMEMFDLARATEWTEALDSWCSDQPDLVPYRGQCLVHQSQLQQAGGEWAKAVSTVRSACERLTDPPHPALGLACYQEAELLRVRGELDAAAEAYGRASKAGYQPMPGFALLEWARGDLSTAVASIRRALPDATKPFQRPSLLAAAVDILLAAGERDAAGGVAAELAAIADRSSSQVLRAMAEQATGSVLLAADQPAAALTNLRAASETWRRLRVPYEAARASVLLGRGCLALGDRSAAELEFDAARETFEMLGARLEVAEIAALTAEDVGLAGGLSRRELEVLAHVAHGKTNPAIAQELSISQHTVGRHLENIFAKLGVRSRAAATAWAYEHDLL